MAVQFNTGSVDATVLALGAVAAITEGQAALEALKAANEALKTQVTSNISLTDHTLADLAALDHPYAKRHGSIQIHTNQGGRIISPPTHLVHKHTGRMARSLRLSATTTTSRLEFDTAIAPHARYVVQARTKMLPRDPIWATARAPKMRKVMMTAIVRRLGKELRTKAVIRFQVAKTSPRSKFV